MTTIFNHFDFGFDLTLKIGNLSLMFFWILDVELPFNSRMTQSPNSYLLSVSLLTKSFILDTLLSYHFGNKFYAIWGEIMPEIDKKAVIKQAEMIPLDKWWKLDCGNNFNAAWTAGAYTVFKYIVIDHGERYPGPDDFRGPYYSLYFDCDIIIDGEKWLLQLFNPAYWLFNRINWHHGNPY